jgi:hypothetical protein
MGSDTGGLFVNSADAVGRNKSPKLLTAEWIEYEIRVPGGSRRSRPCP